MKSRNLEVSENATKAKLLNNLSVNFFNRQMKEVSTPHKIKWNSELYSFSYSRRSENLELIELHWTGENRLIKMMFYVLQNYRKVAPEISNIACFRNHYQFYRNNSPVIMNRISNYGDVLLPVKIEFIHHLIDIQLEHSEYNYLCCIYNSPSDSWYRGDLLTP